MNRNKVHLQSRKCKEEVPKQLVSIEDAAHMLSVSPRTVRRKCDAGVLPQIVKIGHSSRISYQGLLDYISKLTAKLGSIALL